MGIAKAIELFMLLNIGLCGLIILLSELDEFFNGEG